MPKTILVVEDEMLIALDIEATLADLGHAVKTADTVQSATRIVDAGHVDLAILDWHLKDGASDPVIKMLRERGVPFVICSGSSFDPLAEVFAGAPFLPKPYRHTDLLDTVQSLLVH
jgi:DNA-binding response OmpR family regulator